MRGSDPVVRQRLVHVLIDDFVLRIEELVVVGKQVTHKFFGSEESFFVVLIGHAATSWIPHEISHEHRRYQVAILEGVAVTLLGQERLEVLQ